MHYLVVAKVEDYFDVEILMNALTFHDSTRDDQSLCGKWEKIADSVEDIATSEKDEINEVIDNDDISFKDKVLTYIELCGFRLGYDGKVYCKASAHFDYCSFGGRFVNENFADVVPYQKVIDKYGGAGAFVLPDYEFYYTDDNKCPFKPDDLVYVIDGHN